MDLLPIPIAAVRILFQLSVIPEEVEWSEFSAMIEKE
jgi:hypothetical protein